MIFQLSVTIIVLKLASHNSTERKAKCFAAGAVPSHKLINNTALADGVVALFLGEVSSVGIYNFFSC